MKLKFILTPLLLTVLVSQMLMVPALFAPPPVDAWSNGPAVPVGSSNRDGYGTHDWIIDQAMKVVAGRNSGWLDVKVARLASDDPDTCGCSAGINHVYREQGQRGGAIHQITEHYSSAQYYYNLGKVAATKGDTTSATANYRKASQQVGLMAHYYGDILMPWHTNYAAVDKEDSHTKYELLVDKQHRTASGAPAWSSTHRTVTAVANVRTYALNAAAYSRAHYVELYNQFMANQATLTPRASEITGLMLKRASNDLADLIYSIPLGVGNPPAVGKITSSVKWVYPKINEPSQAVYVTATDANGKPMEGLAVDVAWPNPNPAGAPTTIRIFTGPDGKNHWTRTTGASPLMVKRTIGLKATTRGKTVSSSTWFATSPVLATGLTGFKTVSSNYYPRAGQNITVTSTLRDTAGKPVVGMPVTWTWGFASGNVITKGVTNSSGVATSTRTISTSTQLTKVTVAARTQTGSQNRNSSTWFMRK